MTDLRRSLVGDVDAARGRRDGRAAARLVEQLAKDRPDVVVVLGGNLDDRRLHAVRLRPLVGFLHRHQATRHQIALFHTTQPHQHFNT